MNKKLTIQWKAENVTVILLYKCAQVESEPDCSSLPLIPVEGQALAAGLGSAYTQVYHRSGFLASFVLADCPCSAIRSQSYQYNVVVSFLYTACTLPLYSCSFVQ